METKKIINSARDVLVGKVPDPKAQVEQITFAMFYKFMDEMDKESLEIGGKRQFFVGEFEKYSWTKLMDPRLGGIERMDLYTQSLAKMSQNPHIAQLFRDVYKDAFIPFRSPETLNLFLKEIDQLDYTNTESLGDAFEYLLSVMGSQGDAGQFRTPRHIIDFIVKVVDPKKTDTILDPACGTAGFLILSYKHIIKAHDQKDDPDKKEIPLTPDERKQLTKNLTGYDISPDMVRLSKVNMYLHGFSNPTIFEYDTLSDESKWDESFDVMLANPPFMSPKGGIVPHKRFSIQANRSEVLFVDYILEHLKPTGRGGVIVPEGIIFQSANAYKALRKKLIEDGLYCVVSLPAGVFNPYSGVKTSILFFDNEISKKVKHILFVKISSDGFDLGAQRRPIVFNDLILAQEAISLYQKHVRANGKLSISGWPEGDGENIDTFPNLFFVSKEEILKSDDYNLSAERYRGEIDYSKTKRKMVRIDEVVTTITPPTKISKENYKSEGSFPIIDQSQAEISAWTNDQKSLVVSKKPLVIFGDHTCVVKYVDKPFTQGADGIKILLTNDNLIPKFLYYVLKAKPIESEGYKRHFGNLRRYQIPLPTFKIQNQIVTELDGYQKIIDGAKEIITNWKPQIKIDVKWKKTKLGEIADIVAGQSPEGKYYNESAEGTPFYQGKTEFEGIYVGKPKRWTTQVTKIANGGDILMSVRAPVGPVNIATNKICIGRGIAGIKPKKVEQMFLFTYLQMIEKEIVGNGGAVFDSISKNQIEKIEIPLPPTEIQKQIVEKIETERILVESAKKLISIYEQKTKDTIGKLWEE